MSDTTGKAGSGSSSSSSPSKPRLNASASRTSSNSAESAMQPGARDSLGPGAHGALEGTCCEPEALPAREDGHGKDAADSPRFPKPCTAGKGAAAELPNVPGGERSKELGNSGRTARAKRASWHPADSVGIARGTARSKRDRSTGASGTVTGIEERSGTGGGLAMASCGGGKTTSTGCCVALLDRDVAA